MIEEHFSAYANICTSTLVNRASLEQSGSTSQHRQAYLLLVKTITHPFKRLAILFSISARFSKLLQTHKNPNIAHPTYVRSSLRNSTGCDYDYTSSDAIGVLVTKTSRDADKIKCTQFLATRGASRLHLDLFPRKKGFGSRA